MGTHSRRSARQHWWDINPPLWLGLLLCGVLMAVLVVVPAWCSKDGHPWIAVAFAAAALPAWAYLGPRPSPGLLSGFLCLQALVLLFALFVFCLVHAVHGGPGAG